MLYVNEMGMRVWIVHLKTLSRCLRLIRVSGSSGVHCVGVMGMSSETALYDDALFGVSMFP